MAENNQTALGPLMMDLAGLEPNAREREQLQHPLVGGVILFTRNYRDPEQLHALCTQLRALRNPLLIAADTEGGRVQRFRDGFCPLPAAARYGACYRDDPGAGLDMASAGGYVLAAELLACGVDLAFAPVLDVDRGVSEVIGDRAFAGRADAVLALARSFLQGMRRAGMAATGKHFPGHGAVAPDSHHELPVDERHWTAIEAEDLAPYRALLPAALPSVMVAHVTYPQLDAAPASLSRVWLQDILRGQLAFRGAIISDDMSMGGVSGFGPIEQRFARAHAAGCDMLPVCNRPEDLARLLSRATDMSPDPAAQSRLLALRGRARANGLKALHADGDYQRARTRLEQATHKGQAQ